MRASTIVSGFALLAPLQSLIAQDDFQIESVYDEGWYQPTENVNRVRFRQILYTGRDPSDAGSYLLWETRFKYTDDSSIFDPWMGELADAFHITITFEEGTQAAHESDLITFIGESGYEWDRQGFDSNIRVILPITGLKMRDAAVEVLEDLSYVRYAESIDYLYDKNPMGQHLPSPFWVDPITTRNQMRESWIGDVYDWKMPWIYSSAIGWFYLPFNSVWAYEAETQMDLENPAFNCYSVDLGWIYASKSLFPWVYSYQEASWCYIAGDWLYRASDREWKPWRNN
jgi:hypothetical protein